MVKLCCPNLLSFGHISRPPAFRTGTIYQTRAVWYRVQISAACPASGRVCRALHGLPCCLCCAVCPGALGLGSPPAGYIAAAQPRPVSPSTTEKIKKTHLILTNQTPSDCASPKNSAQKQKDSYKGSTFCAILALQALKGRNL